MQILENPVETVLIFIALILSLGMHEAAHAKAAKYFGDTKPAEDGVDTWNPIPHLVRSVFTSVILPAIAWFLSGFFIGGAYVRINPENMKPKRLGYALSVAAGPAMNLLISFLMLFFALLMGLFFHQQASMTIKILLFVGKFNLLLCIFNLIPAPPLDGSAILQTAFPQLRQFFQSAGRFLFMGIILILLLYEPAKEIFFYPMNQYYNLSSEFIQSVTDVLLY